MTEKNKKSPQEQNISSLAASLSKIYTEIGALRSQQQTLASMPPGLNDAKNQAALQEEEQILDRLDALLAAAARQPAATPDAFKLKLAMILQEIRLSDLRGTPCEELANSLRDDCDRL